MNLTAEVNPARAGMIPNLGDRETTLSRKPRASGDDPNGGDHIHIMVK